MFRDEQHPDTSLSNWETFRREYSNFLLEEVVDRSEIKLPDWSVPLARGAAFPSSHLLRKAGYRLGSRRADGWSKPHHDVLWKDIGPDTLVVRGYCNQPLWSIERNGSPGRPHNHPNKTLVHLFGSTPILARNYPSATYLAEFCFLKGPPTGLRWVEECPDDVRGAIEYAQQRRINEALTSRGLLSSLSGQR
jgi:hypothetical protein